MNSQVEKNLESILATSANSAVRNTAREALTLLGNGIVESEIFVLSDDRWTSAETAMSRQEIESEDTWADWPAPSDAGDIAATLADWIKWNS